MVFQESRAFEISVNSNQVQDFQTCSGTQEDSDEQECHRGDGDEPGRHAGDHDHHF